MSLTQSLASMVCHGSRGSGACRGQLSIGRVRGRLRILPAAGQARSALVRMRNSPTISAVLSGSPVFTAKATASYGRGFGSPAFAPVPDACGE